MGISAVHPEAAVSIASRNELGRRLSTEEGLITRSGGLGEAIGR